MTSKMPLTVFALGVCLWSGCDSNKGSQRAETSAKTPQHVSLIPVEDPLDQLCTDDTHSRTEWFNVPVVRFSDNVIDFTGHTTTTTDGLQKWARKYYENKAERGLWVQIAPGENGNAERALLPLVQMFPDLQVFQVEFGFSCPKLHRYRSR